MAWLLDWVDEVVHWRRNRRDRERVARDLAAFAERNRVGCEHDYLCAKYGCPDDPSWKGDRK